MTPIEWLLWPFTLPYGAWMRLRAAAYRSEVLPQKRLSAKVISVGNLTTGGTGKTPLVLYLAERLLAQGYRPAILTRGYHGQSQLVAPSENHQRQPPTSATISDEVQLLRARLGDRVPIGVGADRFSHGRELAASGADCFVLDDGFQHLRLARDVNIVLIDATNPFGGNHLLPAGRLREPKSALSRADIIVVTRSRASQSPALEKLLRRYTPVPVFYSSTILEFVCDTSGAPAGVEKSEFTSKKFFAFCGIGNPQAFWDDLRSWNFHLVGQRAFRDHHRYTQQEAQELAIAARHLGADALLCTEKDLFNLDRVKFEGIDVLYCRIALNIDRESEFWSALQNRMARA